MKDSKNVGIMVGAYSLLAGRGLYRVLRDLGFHDLIRWRASFGRLLQQAKIIEDLFQSRALQGFVMIL